VDSGRGDLGAGWDHGRSDVPARAAGRRCDARRRAHGIAEGLLRQRFQRHRAACDAGSSGSVRRVATSAGTARRGVYFYRTFPTR